ncbi:MAG: hypothetical protein ABJG47_17440 [Ekhidna sp.]
MNEGLIVLLIWLLFAGTLMYYTYRRGQKALSIFPPIDTVKVLYRDRKASVKSNKSLWTKLGAISNSVDLVVTDTELWVKGNKFIASFMTKYDILHKIPLSKVTSVHRKGDRIKLRFKPENYLEKELVIQTTQTSKFIELVKDQIK